MPVKMSQYPAALRATEINCHHSAIHFENPFDLFCALLPGLPWQVVKHQCAKDDVEPPIRKRQVLRNINLERGTRLSLASFASRSRNHRRRGVNARYCAGR